MKIYTDKLKGKPLAWAVAKTLGLDVVADGDCIRLCGGDEFVLDWQTAGAIIESNKIELNVRPEESEGVWFAACEGAHYWPFLWEGRTAIEAAMGAYVAANNLEHEIEIPDQLLGEENEYSRC